MRSETGQQIELSTAQSLPIIPIGGFDRSRLAKTVGRCGRSRLPDYNRFMRILVLTISDRCSDGLQEDTAGPAVVDVVRRAWPEAEIAIGLLRDDPDAITRSLLAQCSEGTALILTAGGTGMGPRDHTPEATRAVLEREAPGLAEALRAKGAEKNPYSWLSRGVAGMKGSTLIVNLPGSRRGAVESIESILPLLRHAIEVAGGSKDHPAS